MRLYSRPALQKIGQKNQLESWVSGLNQQFAKLSYVSKRTGGSNPPLSTSRPASYNLRIVSSLFLLAKTILIYRSQFVFPGYQSESFAVGDQQLAEVGLVIDQLYRLDYIVECLLL